MLIFDNRWHGLSGIGRFSDELRKAIKPDITIERGPKPSNPFDFLWLSMKLRHCSQNDLFISFGYSAPLFFRGKVILTIHDINHVDYESSFLKRIYFKLILNQIIKKALLVITVSKFSCARITRYFSINSNKIQVIPNGVSDIFLSNDILPIKLTKPYFISIGNRKKHKNEMGIIKAYLKQKLSKKYLLVMNGTQSKELLEFITANNLKENVFFKNMLSDENIIGYYKGAEALVFPSIYEGFGLPIIEAFACGCPVITSNTTACAETAEDAALLVNPLNSDEITTAMKRITSDKELRESLIKKGLERAKKFSWNKSRELLKTFLPAEYTILSDK